MTATTGAVLGRPYYFWKDRAMKTYKYLKNGHIVQARDGIGGTGIVREQTGPGYRYKVWFHTGDRIILKDGKKPRRG